MDPNKLTQKTQEAIGAAQKIAVARGHQAVDTEHLLLALCQQEEGLLPRVLAKMERPAPLVGKELERELDRRPSVSGPGAAGEAGREAAVEVWNDGWRVLEATLASLSDADLTRSVLICGVPHSVASALARAVSHVSYHQGQITLIARILVGPARWKTISIPRGGTAQRHSEMGFDPGA